MLKTHPARGSALKTVFYIKRLHFRVMQMFKFFSKIENHHIGCQESIVRAMPTQSERLSLEREMPHAMWCSLNSWDGAKIKTEHFCCFCLLFLVYFMQERKGYILHNSY